MPGRPLPGPATNVVTHLPFPHLRGNATTFAAPSRSQPVTLLLLATYLVHIACVGKKVGALWSAGRRCGVRCPASELRGAGSGSLSFGHFYRLQPLRGAGFAFTSLHRNILCPAARPTICRTRHPTLAFSLTTTTTTTSTTSTCFLFCC